MCICGVPLGVWRGQRITCGHWFSFQSVGSEDRTQIMMFARKCSYPVSHLIGPRFTYFFFFFLHGSYMKQKEPSEAELVRMEWIFRSAIPSLVHPHTLKALPFRGGNKGWASWAGMIACLVMCLPCKREDVSSNP